MLEFANRLSERHGFHPAYDLSGITWESGTWPEGGTLRPVEDNEVDKIRVYAKGKSYDPYRGDIYYQVEGYRLPTLAEQMYMLRGGEKVKSEKFLKNEANLAKHVWYYGNADKRTHPVGLLQAIVIDGKRFYDLFGNVAEGGWDNYTFDLKRYRKKRNPVGLKESYENSHWVAGGNLFTYPSEFLLSYLGGLVYGRNSNKRVEGMGFRLVRTIEQGDGEQ